MKLLIALTMIFSFSMTAQANSDQQLIKELRTQYEAKADALRFKNKHLYSTTNYNAKKRERAQLRANLCTKSLMTDKNYTMALKKVMKRFKSIVKKSRGPASIGQDGLQLHSALKHYGCMDISKN